MPTLEWKPKLQIQFSVVGGSRTIENDPGVDMFACVFVHVLVKGLFLYSECSIAIRLLVCDCCAPLSIHAHTKTHTHPRYKNTLYFSIASEYACEFPTIFSLHAYSAAVSVFARACMRVCGEASRVWRHLRRATLRIKRFTNDLSLSQATENKSTIVTVDKYWFLFQIHCICIFLELFLFAGRIGCMPQSDKSCPPRQQTNILVAYAISLSGTRRTHARIFGGYGFFYWCCVCSMLLPLRLTKWRRFFSKTTKLHISLLFYHMIISHFSIYFLFSHSGCASSTHIWIQN